MEKNKIRECYTTVFKSKVDFQFELCGLTNVEKLLYFNFGTSVNDVFDKFHGKVSCPF